MASPVFQVAGTLNVVTTGNNSPTIPTHQANDILVVGCGIWAPNSSGWAISGEDIAIPTDWNLLGGRVQKDDGLVKDGQIAWFWRRAAGAGTTVTIVRPTDADTGADTAFGAIAYVIRGCITTGDPFDEADPTVAYTAANQAVDAVTVSGSERLVVQFLVSTDNYVTEPFIGGGAWTGADAQESGTGTDFSVGAFYQTDRSSNTGADTATVEAPAAGFYAFCGVSFKPPAGNIEPGALAIDIANPAPARIDQVINPGVLALTRDQVAPSISANVNPAAIALTRDQVAPARVDQTAPIGAHDHALAAVAPRVDQAVAPAAVGLALSPVAPARVDQAVHPAALALALATLAPQLDQRADPGALALTLTALAPEITQPGLTVNPDALSLTAAVVTFSRIDQELSPGALAQALAAVAPRIDQAVSPAVMGLTRDQPAPSRIDQAVNPAALDRALSIPAPEITGGGGQSVSPDALGLALAVVNLDRINQELVPDALDQSLDPAEPRVDLSVSPAAINRALAVVAWARLDQTVNPGPASRSLTPVGPRLDLQIVAGVISRALAFPSPALALSIFPDAAARTLVPVSLGRIDQTLSPSQLALLLVAIAPNLGGLFPADAVATFIKVVIAAAAVVQGSNPVAAVVLSPPPIAEVEQL